MELTFREEKLHEGGGLGAEGFGCGGGLNAVWVWKGFGFGGEFGEGSIIS